MYYEKSKDITDFFDELAVGSECSHFLILLSNELWQNFTSGSTVEAWLRSKFGLLMISKTSSTDWKRATASRMRRNTAKLIQQFIFWEDGLVYSSQDQIDASQRCSRADQFYLRYSWYLLAKVPLSSGLLFIPYYTRRNYHLILRRFKLRHEWQAKRL